MPQILSTWFLLEFSSLYTAPFDKYYFKEKKDKRIDDEI